MTNETIRIAFQEWWNDSYGTVPGVHALMTHVAFGEHLLHLSEVMEPEEAFDDQA